MAKVRQALDIINQTLSEFPPGSELQKTLTDFIRNISKQMPPSDAALGVNQTALRDLQQNAGKNAMLQQVMSSLGAGGAQQQGGAAGAAPPPTPGAM